jgi:iron complex outermembrane receptor protein
MRTSRLMYPPLLIALLCAGESQAGDDDLTTLSLDQLLSVEIVTASKFAQKVSEAPSSVSIVTADDIKTFGYRTLADILRSMRGIYVAYDRNYSYFGTRGSGRPGDYNSRVLLLVDGQRFNDSVYGQAAVGTEFPIDMDLIERVEYVPGPGSAIYGSNAFFGVINIITKKARALNGIAVAGELASFGTRKASLTVGKRFENGGEALLSVSNSVSRGIDRYFPEFDDAASNHGVATGLDGDRTRRLFAKYSFQSLTLTAFLGQRRKALPTASFGQQFNDPRSYVADDYFSATAAFHHALSRTVDLDASLHFSRYQYRGDYAYTGALNHDLSNSAVVTADLRLLSRAAANHKLILGIEMFDAIKRRQESFNVDPYALVFSTDHPTRGYALYVQDEIRLGDRLILNAGLRHDHNAEGGNANSPRLGLIYSLTPDITTKLLYGSAFRSANAYEAHYFSDTGNRPGPVLAPEHIKTYEFVAEYFPRQDFRSSATVFAYRMDKLIALGSDSVDQQLFFTNLGAASAKGVELEAETLGADGSRLKASASLQFAQDNATGRRLTNSPKQLANLHYSHPYGPLSGRAGVEIGYTGKRATITGMEIGGFTVVNLTLSDIKLAKNVLLSASIYNLLDKNYADPPSDEHFDNSAPARTLRSIRQDGRSFRVNLAYRF